MVTTPRRARAALLCAMLAAFGPSMPLATAANEAPAPSAATTAAAERLYREGKFQAAFDAFAAAFLSQPSPEILRWMGRCQAGLRSWDAAEFFYRGYLEGAPEAPDRIEVERQIAEAEAAKAAQSVALPAASPSTPVYRRWWLWTTLGVVVAGGATAAGILLWPRPLPSDTLGTYDGR